VPPDVHLRDLRWPEDQVHLARIDISFTTDRIYELHSSPPGFTLVERAVAPALIKRYDVSWEELATADVALVAEREGIIIGVAALGYRLWNRRAEVSHLYVDRFERGAGVGTSLLVALQARARERDARCLWVETQNVNVPAIGFYRRNGFVLSGLDTSLYDPRRVGYEIALFFALPFDQERGPLDVILPPAT
jgi:ribosomal protein S18 acetylase RimI-like enzyme